VSNSWDDDIPNIWKNNPNVPNHQPGFLVNANSDMTSHNRFHQQLDAQAILSGNPI